MLLYISIGLAIISGLINPFINRIDLASIWLSRVLSAPAEEIGSENMNKRLQRINHMALRTGGGWFLGTLETIMPFTIFAAIIIGLFYAWWLSILVYIISLIINSIVELSRLYPKFVDYYILFFYKRLINRAADYSKKNDFIRAEAATEYSDDLNQILSIYLDQSIFVPETNISKNCPPGDKYYLLNLKNGSTKK